VLEAYVRTWDQGEGRLERGALPLDPPYSFYYRLACQASPKKPTRAGNRAGRPAVACSSSARNLCGLRGARNEVRTRAGNGSDRRRHGRARAENDRRHRMPLTVGDATPHVVTTQMEWTGGTGSFNLATDAEAHVSSLSFRREARPVIAPASPQRRFGRRATTGKARLAGGRGRVCVLLQVSFYLG
jgi:hypothetical protein